MQTTTVLTCHPETRAGVVKGMEAGVTWTPDNALALTYALTGDLTRLRVSAPGLPRRANRLWQHTCFEAFVAPKGKSEYYEFNFAPSGEWGAYRFQRYRDQSSLDTDLPAPKITVRNGGDRLDLDAIIRLDCMTAIPSRAGVQLALAAVIEDENGMLSYWALRHPPGKPDFHHRDSFVLGLEPFGVTSNNDPAHIGKR